MKETTAAVLALLTFVAAVYLMNLTNTPGVGWRTRPATDPSTKTTDR